MDDVSALNEKLFGFAIDFNAAGNTPFVLRVADKLIGYVLYNQCGDFVDIYYMAIVPELHGLGHGKRLMEAFIQQMQLHGVNAFTLEVRADNKAAIKLYEQSGFKTVWLRKGYYSDDEDALLMKLAVMFD